MQTTADYPLQGGKYKLKEVLGEGGFGITYLAVQTMLNRMVAIKEFKLSGAGNIDAERVESLKQLFLKEARTIASFNHPGIIKIHDVFEENGRAYYVMDYLTGGSLTSYVTSRGCLDERHAVEFMRRVCSALGYVHQRKYLHLDIKPDNIMLDDSGSPVLIDFGISKHYDAQGKETATLAGAYTPGFAPIEQYTRGNLTTFMPATDVYSLGATLYFMVTGKCPPDAHAIIEHGVPAVDGVVSRQTASAITGAMRPSHRDRLQTVEEFARLLPVMSGAPSGAADAYSREDIEDFIIAGDSRMAYRMCLYNASQHIDEEWCRRHAADLKDKLRRKEMIRNVLAVISIVVLVALSALLRVALS